MHLFADRRWRGYADRRWRGYVRPSDLAELILEIGELTRLVHLRPRADHAPLVFSVEGCRSDAAYGLAAEADPLAGNADPDGVVGTFDYLLDRAASWCDRWAADDRAAL